MNSGSQNNRWVGMVRWLTMITMGIVALVLISRSQLYAQEGSAAAATGDPGLGSMEFVFWGISFIGSLVALWFAWQFYKSMIEADEGTPRMIEIAGYVRDGAQAYLTQQYKVVTLFFIVIFGLLFVASFVMNVQSKFVPFAFITGGFFSGLAGFFGMKTATWASSRTAAGAQKSLNAGLQVAFRSGAVMGLTVGHDMGDWATNEFRGLIADGVNYLIANPKP